MPELKTYRIMERITHMYAPDTLAASPEEACKILGWPMDKCWVREQTFTKNEYGTRPSGWKSITPRHVPGEDDEIW